MDYEREIQRLSAETIAMQWTITSVLEELQKLDPAFRAAIARGFDNAASGAEHMAIQAGKDASPEHLVKAIEIIETLRTAVLGKHDKPRHGV
jgi:hypothetical protein